ncbi:Na+/H+ antiporter NhaD/arsenite permease-like protein [Paenibacillus sp. V4I7]|nr:Na+/H+ antiporter NhaD/arsenite permease-like protein [Paenibacillus sp. V4I7]
MVQLLALRLMLSLPDSTPKKVKASYLEFMKVDAPITLVSLALAHVYIYIRYLL